MKLVEILIPAIIIFASQQVNAEAVLASPKEDLQAILDRGDDLLLKKGTVYLIEETLKYKHKGQRIATKDAERISDYATLRLNNSELGRLINGNQLPDIILEKVIVDGNRYRLSAMGATGNPQPALLFFGGGKSKNQIVQYCVMLNTRTWSTLKIHEGGTGITAKNNIIFGAGAGARGNGRDAREIPFGWGDGVSCGARNSTISNNLIVDPGDAGIVIFGAPGSLVEDNVIAAISRESLGAINMVDPLELYVLNEDHTLYDFSGVVVRSNWMDAFGGRFHIAMPMGVMPWAPKHKGKVLTGARVHNNLISGGAGGYGYVLDGVDNFNVYDNESTAEYSGIGDGQRRKPPDDPGPFLYNPNNVKNGVRQAEFKPMERHLIHLLRCNHGPRNTMGYRVYPYGDAEVRAVVYAAYREMLGRAPTYDESIKQTTWLQKTKGTSDQLRRILMTTDEFIERFGYIDPLYLHLFRTTLWLEVIDRVLPKLENKEKEKWPEAKDIYEEALLGLHTAHEIPGIKETMAKIKNL